jgi:tRNA-Thr(GGU) m(6)t(6)A37 methyltransferase TsaA
MRIIAYIHTDFPQKFGIPRQSGIVEGLIGKIVFEPQYRNPDAFQGLEGFSHIWLLWQFSGSHRDGWSATVKPPRLGGNKRMGVFATRSPYRPNDIGLSSVRLERIEYTKEEGPVLYVKGVDLLDGTPIYDIKPYLAYTDSHPEATEGFAQEGKEHRLEIVFPEELLKIIPKEKRTPLMQLLEQDPRPAYQDDPQKRYGVAFAGYDIRFYVQQKRLSVCEVVPFREPEQNQRVFR